MTRFAPVNARDRNSPSGSIGDRARASTATNAAIATAPPASAATIAGERNPSSAAPVSPHVRLASPAAARLAPSQSSPGGCSLLLSGAPRSASHTAATASGTFR